MELKDMNFPQVLGLNIFRDELYAQMQIELQALKEASRHGKVARMALTSLIDKGKFNTTEFTTAYYHIMHKEATRYSANERQYITDVCTIAYTKTIRRLQQESNENRRNPILRWWRMLTAWLKMKLNQNRSEDEKL
jgi:hypothetical protein